MCGENSKDYGSNENVLSIIFGLHHEKYFPRLVRTFQAVGEALQPKHVVFRPTQVQLYPSQRSVARCRQSFDTSG
jgi:hypothetical protein